MRNRRIFFAVLMTVSIWSCKKNYRPDPATDTMPSISFVSPLSDSVGKKIVIEGKNFTPGLTVSFNGVPATVEWSNHEEIHFRIPQNATSGKITVTSDGIPVTYPVDITIKSGARQFYTDAEGGMIGARIAVNVLGGSLYNKTPVVKFNGIIAETFDTGYTLMIAIVPKGATSGNISLTVDGKTYVNNFKVVPGSFSTYLPFDVTTLRFDASGTLYDVFENKVIKINSAGVKTTVATIGSKYTSLTNCVVDKAGNVYVASPSDRDSVPPSRYHYTTPNYTTNNSVIYKITPAGNVSKFAGSGKMGNVDGPGASAQFFYPTHLSMDNSDNLIVSDGAVLKKVRPDGFVSSIAGSNLNVQTAMVDGKGTSASFIVLGPTVIDPSGNIFALDAQVKLRKITPSGEVSTIRFVPSDGSPFGEKTYLLDLAFHPSGDLYFNAGGPIYVLKKNDLQNSTGVIYNTYLNPLPKLSSSYGIAIDKAGNLFINGTDDLKSGRVVKVVL